MKIKTLDLGKYRAEETSNRLDRICSFYVVEEKNTKERSLVLLGCNEIIFIGQDGFITYDKLDNYFYENYIIIEEVTEKVKISL